MTGALYLSSVKKVISLLLSLCFSYTPHTLTLSVTRHTAPSCYVLLKRQSSKMALLKSQRRHTSGKSNICLNGIMIIEYIFKNLFIFWGRVSELCVLSKVWHGSHDKGNLPPLFCSSSAVCACVSPFAFIHFVVACIVKALKPCRLLACQQPCPSNSFWKSCRWRQEVVCLNPSSVLNLMHVTPLLDL